jgi:hypothetical protein
MHRVQILWRQLLEFALRDALTTERQCLAAPHLSGGGFVALLLRLEFSPSYLRERTLENAVAECSK